MPSTRFTPRSPLYAILDAGYVAPDAMVSTAIALLDAGICALQLRAKNWQKPDIEVLARRILPLCRSRDIPFIINDFPDIAREIGADGVHIGQDDGDLTSVRNIVGQEMLIGRSTHSLPQALTADDEGFDYIGFGPLYPTGTKPGRSAIGLTDLAAVNSLVRCPVFAIGGINLQTLPHVIAAGARRVVIVSALLHDPTIAEKVLTAFE